MGATGLRVLCGVPVLAMLLGPPCSSLTSALVPGRVAGRGCEKGRGCLSPSLHPHVPRALAPRRVGASAVTELVLSSLPLASCGLLQD